MIDEKQTPTEARIPTPDSPVRTVLEYVMIALVCGNDTHRSEVAKLVSEWIEKSEKLG